MMKFGVTFVTLAALVAGCRQSEANKPSRSAGARTTISLEPSSTRSGSWVTEGFEAFSKGTFESAGNNLYVSKRGRLQMIRVWDLNRDGNVDLFFAQSHDHVSHQPARVYFQRDGQPRQDAMLLLPSEAAVGELITDLNGDGYEDLVLLNAKNGINAVPNAYIYWGGTGGLTPKFRSGVPVYQGLKIFAADLDGDGRKELISLNDGRKIQGKPDGFVTIHGQTSDGFPNGRRTNIPTPVLMDGDLADITGDGRPDLVLLVQNGETRSLLLMSGTTGGFTPPKVLAANQDARKVRLIKLSKGWIIATTSETAIQLHTLLEGALQTSRRIELAGVTEVIAGDFDDDQRADLISVNPQGVHCLSASSDFDLTRATHLPVANVRSVAVGDVTGDGLQDLAVAVYQGSDSHKVDSRIYVNKGAGFDANRFIGLQTSGATSVSIGDLNHDGKSDVALAGNMGGPTGYAMPAVVYFGAPDGNFDPTQRLELPAFSSTSGCMADFNDDGFVDLFIANEYEAATDPKQTSRIYWGASGGLSPSRFLEIPTKHACIAVTADINRDGYLDIVVASYEEDPIYVYWGGADTYSAARSQKIDLPEAGLINLADVNKDGWLDLVCPMFKREESYVLLGDQNGYRLDRRLVLPIEGALVAEAADLDADGWLDLLTFAHWPLNVNLYTRPVEMVPSYIWWGSEKGYSAYRRTEFVLEGLCIDAAVADLNKDGFLDIAGAIYHQGNQRTSDSFILWGAKDRVYGMDRITRLRQDSAAAVTVADFNNDGWPDICFANHVKLGDHHTSSRVHWNRKGTFTDTDTSELATIGPHESLTVDLGNAYHRGPDEAYISAPFQRPPSTRFRRLSWEAQTDFGSTVAFQIRAAATREELSTAKWTGPRGGNSEFRDSRSALSSLDRDASWIQYRAILRTRNGAATPIITKVAISYE